MGDGWRSLEIGGGHEERKGQVVLRIEEDDEDEEDCPGCPPPLHPLYRVLQCYTR
jgi:hypothetical protein